jgi:hypothetical protein
VSTADRGNPFEALFAAYPWDRRFERPGRGHVVRIEGGVARPLTAGHPRAAQASEAQPSYVSVERVGPDCTEARVLDVHESLQAAELRARRRAGKLLEQLARDRPVPSPAPRSPAAASQQRGTQDFQAHEYLRTLKPPRPWRTDVEAISEVTINLYGNAIHKNLIQDGR